MLVTMENPWTLCNINTPEILIIIFTVNNFKSHPSEMLVIYYLTSTAKQVLGNCERMVFAVKLCLIILVVNLFVWHCTCSLVYWYTVHAKSVMNHACVMSVPVHLPFSKCMYLKYCMKRVFILNYVIWNENEWRVIDILLAIDISETQYRTE